MTATGGTSRTPSPLVRRGALTLLCAAQFMLVLDIAIVNVSLPAIQADLGFRATDLQWIISAYALTFGGFLILAGRAGDLFGRRLFFLLGVGTFSAASLGCGLAQSATVLVLSRGLQGAGAAMVSPAALSLITTIFREGEERNKALGLWGAVAAGGAAAGVLLGGIVTDIVGWRWVFLMNLPIGILLLAITPRLIHESRERTARRQIDVVGATALTAGLIALVFALSRVEVDGPDSVQVWGLVLASLILLAFFVGWEKRSNDPLVPFSLFRSRSRSGANIVALLTSAIIAGQAFFSSLYLQQVLGYSAVKTGLAFLPITFTVMTVATLVPQLLKWLNVRTLLITAAISLGVGMTMWSRVPTEGAYLRDVLPALIVVAVGLGLSFTGALIAATSGVSDAQQGLASGMLNTSEQVGSSFGVAILATVAASRYGQLVETTQPEVALTGAFQQAFRAGVGIAVVELLIAFFVLPRLRDKPTSRQTPVGTVPAPKIVPVEKR